MNNRTNKSFKMFFLCILAMAIFAIPMVVMYNHEEIHTVKVLSINQRMHVSGSDGNTSSTYEYLVSTDQGVFKIEPDGIFYSNDFGHLHEGETYTVKTRGYSVPILGIYPFISQIIE